MKWLYVAAILFFQSTSASFTGWDPKPKVLLLPYLYLNFLHGTADAVSDKIVKVVRDKVKTEKGETLYQSLSELVEEMKTSFMKHEVFPIKLLQKVMSLKNKFKKIQDFKGDLSEELMIKFKDKVIEAFQLILQNSGLPTNDVVEMITNQIEEKRKSMAQDEL